MRLNQDCVRSVLLYLEEALCIESGDADEPELLPLPFCSISAALCNFASEDVFYTLFNLEQAGFLHGSFLDPSLTAGTRYVFYVTYSGHQFLDSIRDEKRWRWLKSALNGVRDYSLDAVSALAKGVTAAAISEILSKL